MYRLVFHTVAILNRIPAGQSCEFSNRSHALNPTNNLAQKPHHNKKLQQVAMHPVDSEVRHDVSENIAPLNPEIKYEIPKKISTTKTTSLSLDVRRTQESV